MSTDTLYAIKTPLNPPRAGVTGVRNLALRPTSAMPRPEGSTNGRSTKVLTAVVAMHAALFYLALTSPVEPPAIERPETPMLVSLVENPAPELKAPEPAPPEPKPVVKKIVPKPKKLEPTPVPEVVQSTPVPPVVAPEPVKVAEQVTQPEPPKQEVIEKPAPLKEEPVIEPKFGAAYLKNPPPDYPTLSRRVGEQGRVLLRVLVSEQGAPQSVELESGSGYNRLDQAAMDAVKKWRFIPARKGNQAISAYVLVPLKFSLDG